ncbi:MAG: ComF family protein [Clostridia bacterium]|nr:ComF family protein [Clostridia bacterium]MBR2953325.1 ComF family protein [Clostridia bacterium]MBR2953340.1 ComF family protein [Clostridia bacterium]
MGRIKDALLWLLLTNKCTYCGKLLNKGETLCEDCKNHLPRITGERCKYCGAGKIRCKCNKHKMRYDGITSPFYYEDGVVDGIARLKFGGRDFMAYHFAKDMAKSIETDFAHINFDYMTFVPISSFQQRHRDYNQSELLATELSKLLSLPVRNVLIKIFDNDIQHESTQNRRKGNVLGVYDVRENEDVNGKTILLVDDIKTTGATLNECAKILKIRGAEKVYCVTVALTGKKVSKDLDN